jgi:uncharacterized protein
MPTCYPEPSARTLPEADRWSPPPFRNRHDAVRHEAMSELRIDVADLLSHPGARRSLHREVTVEGLAASAARIDRPVVLDLVLERVPDGIVARGSLRAQWEGDCGVCLRALTGELDVAVSELFEDAPVEGDTYLLLGHHIDLEQLVRDALLLELPLTPTCASTGGSPCHSDAPRDDTDDVAPVDPRWAALSELDL